MVPSSLSFQYYATGSLHAFRKSSLVIYSLIRHDTGTITGSSAGGNKGCNGAEVGLHHNLTGQMECFADT